MLSRRASIMLATSIALLTTCVVIARLAPKNELPPAIWAVLEKPDRYELLSLCSVGPLTLPDGTLQPQTRPADPTTKAVYSHGFLVLGGVTLTDAKARQRVNGALRDSMRDWPQVFAGCGFQPRHAIRAVRGGKTVELLICFHCGDMEALVNGVRERGQFYVDHATPPAFQDVLKAANVPVEEDAED
jgi:hypothetical protein